MSERIANRICLLRFTIGFHQSFVASLTHCPKNGKPSLIKKFFRNNFVPAKIIHVASNPEIGIR